MDNWDTSEVQVGGFSAFGLLLAFSLVATFLFAIYWLWGCSCSDGMMESKGSNQINRVPTVNRHTVVPLYAFEIEPGTVILQSGDGEIFRILREYDSVGRTGSGSPPLYASVATSQPTNDYHYMPSYTRAHFQNRPTAPDYDSGNQRQEGADIQNSPADDRYGDNVPLWTPINIQSG